MKEFKLFINPADRRSRISPEIYGHFSEHLGRCIYGGIYVGEDSEIPNVRGIRTDIVPEFNAKYQLALGDTVVYRDDSLNVVRALKGKVRQYAVSNGFPESVAADEEGRCV